MLDIQYRSDRLLADIEFREREIEKHRQEIKDRALKLDDGRRVYFDGVGYRDETGRVISSSDATEAEVLHRRRPDAPTWQERQKTIDERDEMKRLRQKVLKEKQEAAEGGQGLSPEELNQWRNGLRGTDLQYESIDKIRDVLASILTSAIRYGLLVKNPAEGVRLPRAKRGKASKPWITKKQFSDLVEFINELLRDDAIHGRLYRPARKRVEGTSVE